MRGVNKVILVGTLGKDPETRKVHRGKAIARNPGYHDDLRERLVRNSVIGVPGLNVCWMWIRNYQGNGYGAARAFGRMMPAHRASFLAFKGEIPEGLEVGHSCHNRGCINPEHLSPMTHAENMRQMRSRRRTQ